MLLGDCEREAELGRFWIEATDSRRERAARDWKETRVIFGDGEDEEGEIESEVESEVESEA